MKKLILLIVAGLCLPALGQSNGVYNATTYAYTTQVTQGNAATGSSSILANPTAFAQGIPFLPYNLNASITINRNAATAETLAPSAIANCFPNSLTCTLSGTFSFKHISGESIQSGTFGLQEAINIAVVAGSGTVVIDASWQGPSGTSVILAAKGASSVMIQDNRNPSGATFYQWNGSAYVATGGSSAVSSVFGRVGAVAAQSGDYTCAQITGCATAGVVNLNGQTGAQTLVAGSNIVITPNGTNQILVATSGSAGSGSVAAGLQYQAGCYPNSGSNTTIGPCPHVWTINPAMTGTQMTTFLATLTSGVDIVQIPPAFGQTQFTNTNNIFIRDYRQGAAMVQFGQYGIACNAQQITISLTSGVNTVNIGGSTLSAGETFFIGQRTGFGVDAAQQSWLPTISSIAGSTATLSGNAPFNFSGQVWVGSDNTAQFQLALNDSSSLFPLSIPGSCFMLTQQVSWNNGQSIIAQAAAASAIIGAPGQDILQQPDQSGGGAGVTGSQLKNVQFLLDGTIDRAQGGYTAYNAAGTGTAVPPLYRPLHEYRPDSNDPLATGWAQNAINGVASTTQNLAVICYSTASGQKVPVVGRQIVFRDFPTGVYVTTVSSLTGSGCTGSTSPATLAATFPNTSGYTQSQIEWVSTSSVLTSNTALPATINYPFTITLNQSIAPIPGLPSNVAQHGHVFIAGQQFDYLGVSYTSPYTMTLRRGPSSCSGVDCSTGFAIVPANPCEANYSVPYPVTPTINSGDSTPHGAVYFPGECGGNFAISFPQVNGNTYSGPGLVNGILHDVVCGLSEGPQQTNNNGCFYSAGNTAPYSTELWGFKVEFLQYGFAWGPASAGMHGVGLNGPTGAGNSIRDCQIHAAFPISLTDFQNGKIDRCDTYPSEVNPYDGTGIGSSTWLDAGTNYDEQTGTGISFVTFLAVDTSFGEPENGSHAEIPASVQIGASFAHLTNNNFEGGFNVFDGNNIEVIGGQLSNPLVLYGSYISISKVYGLNLVFSNNTWPTQFANWGQANTCNYYTGGGFGPLAACSGPGIDQSYDGHDIQTNLNPVHPNQNLQGGKITMGEWQSVGLPTVFDSTELWWGQHAECVIGSGLQCGPMQNFDGFGGQIFIGPWQRITDAPMRLFGNFSLKSSGSATANVKITAQSQGGSCTPNFNLANKTLSATFGTWTPFYMDVDFTGTAGCTLGVQFDTGSVSNTLEVGYFYFVPTVAYIQGPASAPTEGAACPAGTPNGAWLGAFSGFAYFCDGGTVHRVAIS